MRSELCRHREWGRKGIREWGYAGAAGDDERSSGKNDLGNGSLVRGKHAGAESTVGGESSEGVNPWRLGITKTTKGRENLGRLPCRQIEEVRKQLHERKYSRGRQCIKQSIRNRGYGSWTKGERLQHSSIREGGKRLHKLGMELAVTKIEA